MDRLSALRSMLWANGFVFKLILSSLGSLAAYGLYQILRVKYRHYKSPLNILPGPPNASTIIGNLGQIRDAEPGAMHTEWIEKYGPVIQYKGFFGEPRLFAVDPRALNHILTHSVDYQKPEQARFNLSRLLGPGVLVTEGEKHRQQRRIMNPTFGPASIKTLTSIFLKKSLQLRDIWSMEVSKAGEDKTKTIEVLSWLSRATLDVIGLAGFDYRFDSLNVIEEPTELNKAFSTLFHAENKPGIYDFVTAFVPSLRILSTKRTRAETKAHATMSRIGSELLQERKRAVLGMVSQKDREAATEEYGINGRDLLTALVKSNMDTEIPEAQRMSDRDVLAQVPTFLVAGHETTSTETMWSLFALAQEPEIQNRLRAELQAFPTDTPSADELNGLPFLDAVVRETLRLHAAVPSTTRRAMHDDIIPLSEPITDRNGVKINEIKISKGDGIFIPILAINVAKSIWGEDAETFNPDRWFNVPEAAKDIPGVWGHMLTFLGGARSCIGYRFALYEMKALLFVLLRTFEFELSLPAEEYKKRSFVVTRPYLKSDPAGGAKMPLRVKFAHK